jgi:fluoroquinolone transport system permease protein
MNRVVALLKNDFKNIIREWILIYIAVVPGGLALASRWLVPRLADYLATEIGFDLTNYYPLITGYFVIFVPILMGMVTGFLLLDEQDGQVVKALIVTPLAKQGYLAYRVLLPWIAGFIYSLVAVFLLGLVEVAFLPLLPAALVSSLEAPLVALFLIVFAGNKVEGLALSKGLGLFMLAPMADFVLGKWKLIAGIMPTYWPVQGVVRLIEGTGGYWSYILIGLVLHLFLIKLLVDKFERSI